MFWDSFLPNFFSDLLAGVIIGAAVGWFVSRRLAASERAESDRSSQIAKSERAIQYLSLLGKEIELLNQTLPDQLRIFSETGWGREIRIETPFWESVDRAGELPLLLSPNMVRSLTYYYSDIAVARRGRDLLVTSWLVPNPATVPALSAKQQAFIAMTEASLRKAIDYGPQILEHVSDNIEVLESELRIRADSTDTRRSRPTTR